MIMIVNHESKTKDMLCKTKSEFLFECSQMSTGVQLESQTLLADVISSIENSQLTLHVINAVCNQRCV